MEKGQRVFHRYSLAFKQKIVSEIECGELKIGDAQRIYDINGAETIQRWIRKLGKGIDLHVVFPPFRVSKDLLTVADYTYRTKWKRLRQFQFSDPVIGTGFSVSKPVEWA